MSAARPEPTDYLAAARALAPQVAASAEAIERERHLPGALVEALAAAGLFQMLLPASVGGGEIDPRTYSTVIEEVAKADASTAWCLSQGNGCAMIAAYLDPAFAREAFGDRRAVLAWGPPSESRAVPVEGGYRVSGRWSFASGCHHATWLGAQCPVILPDGTPRRWPGDEPDFCVLLIPPAAATFTDIWRVSGLRGTGSDAYAVADLFVPEARLTRNHPAARRETGPLYRFTTTHLYATGFASVALGIARATLDAFIALAGGKTPRQLRARLCDSPVVQAQVAHAEAAYRGARAFLHATLGESWAAVQATGDLPLAQRALIRLAATDAIHRAASVVDIAFQAAGATAIFESNPFERRFRDMHAVTQQIQGRLAHYEAAGQFFLGLDVEADLL